MMSAATTSLGERLLLTLAMLAIMGLIYAAMWRGWHRRSDQPFPDLADRPADWHEEKSVDAVYASTTLAGQWLVRVRDHGLGQRSPARVCVGRQGVLIERTGERDLFIPRGQIRSVSLVPGIAGKVVGGRGVVVITWSWGDRDVDTGFLPEMDRRSELVEAILELIND